MTVEQGRPYASSPNRRDVPGPQRVYLPGSSVAHLIGGLTSLNQFPYALAYCRVAPTWGVSEWFGTGSQTEYDEAERRRLCSRCARRARL